MSQNNADGMANSADPDQTALGAVSTLLAKAYMSENLGSLRYYSRCDTRSTTTRTVEPPQDKTNKMAYEPSEDSD